TRMYQKATQNPYGGVNSPTPNTINKSNDFAMKRCRTVALGKTRVGAWSCSRSRMPPVSGTYPAPATSVGIVTENAKENKKLSVVASTPGVAYKKLVRCRRS